VSVALSGIVVALGYAPFGLGAFPGGILADRYGTKRLLVLVDRFDPARSERIGAGSDD